MLSNSPKGQRAARAPLRDTTAVTSARDLQQQPHADSLLLAKINIAKLSDVAMLTQSYLTGHSDTQPFAWRRTVARMHKIKTMLLRRSPKQQLATTILFPRRSPEQCTACWQHMSNRRRAQGDRRHRTPVTVRRLPS
jgi:hypothetical protein